MCCVRPAWAKVSKDTELFQRVQDSHWRVGEANEQVARWVGREASTEGSETATPVLTNRNDIPRLNEVDK